MKEGTDFSFAIKIGLLLGEIKNRLRHLERDVDESLMMHNMYESLPVSDTKQLVSENQNRIVARALVGAREINRMVSLANKGISISKHESIIQSLHLKGIEELIKQRFRSIYDKGEAQKLSNENFRLKLNRIFLIVNDSVIDFMKLTEEERKFDFRDQIKNDKYSNGIEESIDIFSFGHYKTSIFVIGRTLEDVVTDVLILAMKKGRVGKKKISSLDYKDKIGLLYGKNVIDDKLFHDLSSIRIDRNKSGHPIKRTFKKGDNKLFISKGISTIIELQKKSDFLKRL